MFKRGNTGAFAMQEIEVIRSMDEDEDDMVSIHTEYITLSPPSRYQMTADSSWPPSTLTPFELAHHHPPLPLAATYHQEEEEEQSAAMEVLLAMLANEQTMSIPVDFKTRSTIASTPIAASACKPGIIDDDSDPVNEYDRKKMCDWYYEMADFLKIDRMTASRSLSILDRFVAAPVQHMILPSSTTTTMQTMQTTGVSSSSSSTIDRSNSFTLSIFEEEESYTVSGVIVAATRMRDEYQLVALTSLFLSIKLYERLNIEPDHVSYLSRGRYTSDEVIRMERVILQALEWRVCCPTKIDYVNAYLDVMLPTPLDDDTDHDPYIHVLQSSVRELVNTQIKHSDSESSFARQRPSLVALACIINAFEMQEDDIASPSQQMTFTHIATDLISRLDHHDQVVELPRTAERLRAFVDTPLSMQQWRWSYHCGGGSTSSSSFHLPLRGNTTPSNKNDASSCCQSSSSDNRSSSSSDVMNVVDDAASSNTVSPLDLALETMGSFETALSLLLCCGADVNNNTNIFHGEEDVVTKRYHGSDTHLPQEEGNGSIAILSANKQQQGQGCDDDGMMMTQSHSSPTSISNNA